MKSIAICTPTFQRPEYLRCLLESFVALQRPDLHISFIIVDNDSTGTARSVTEEFRSDLPDLVYEIEHDRGIAAARNRLVAIASQRDVDYVAFIDDDEWVHPAWLMSMAATMREHDADAIAGPVLPHHDPQVSEWMISGGFFDEREPNLTGEEVRVLGMGNQLIKREWLDKIDGPFNRELALTGGEDPYLWGQLFRLGLRMIWCNEAVVYERIPASKATASWLLMRHFNYGIAGSRVVREVESSLMARINRLIRCLGRMCQGVVLFPFSIFRGRAAMLRSAQYVSRGIGGLLGIAGVQYHPYKRIHGR